ncbi:calpain-8-like [Ornithodoros turicata]|uniref:calpain-8-like n=1 Tax=Ornithodoros turicata TaxID=34597 RepID=UPI00313994CE
MPGTDIAACDAIGPDALPWDPNEFDSKFFNLGERGSGYKTKTGKVQDFHDLHKHHLNSKTLFEDPEFPCGSEALGDIDPGHPVSGIVWKRPTELCNSPVFLEEGESTSDVMQGDIGDCWMLVAMANLALRKDLFHRVVPEGQSFENDWYAGIFHFCIWKDNRWIDVVVDDRLPVSPATGKLLATRSNCSSEFWSALLEKAYAKLHNSYGALVGGGSAEAMEDFTGGITLRMRINEAKTGQATVPRDEALSIMKEAYEHGSLMGSDTMSGAKLSNSCHKDVLLAGHAYSITALEINNGVVERVCLRNPWGTASNSSQCTREDKEAGLEVGTNGEFKLDVDYFFRDFYFVHVCYLHPESYNTVTRQSSKADCDTLDKASDKDWKMFAFEGAWILGATAGGYKDAPWENPQFVVRLQEADDETGLGTMIVAVLQRHVRGETYRGHEKELATVGFLIYEIDEKSPQPLDKPFISSKKYVCNSDYAPLREVTKRVKLPPGTYCVIPTTYSTDVEGQFLLRILTRKNNCASVYDKEFCWTP